ncbi:hypothetical protein L2V07_14655, partial [Staphylococcus aureus]|nr:hypothetical protein [Staphylococcus aureus]
MNKINDRDLTELSGYWVYQDINTNKEIKVNGKRFMQVDSYNDDKNRNLNGAADIKIYELLDDKSKPTGQQTIVYQGTSNEAINPKNPLRSKNIGDDWIQNIKLMNDSNMSTQYLNQADEFSNQYKKKIEDANKLSKSEFLRKYNTNPKNYKHKSIVADGGNSEGGAGAKYHGAKHQNENIVASNPAMLPYASWEQYKNSKFKNMISFHSTNDLLSWLQDPFAKEMPGKRINIRDGVPTLNGLIDSHLGFKREFNSKSNEYKDIPVHKIESVKDTEIKNGKEVKKVININLDMDGRIPINVWTGDSIARSGKGENIKLDIEKLGDLYQLVTGETSIMLQECVTEEMMKHLKIVSENIVLIKNQNDIYGNQIADIKSIMSYQDATIMDGNLNINYNGQHMVSGKVNLSKYLSRKMTILKNHIDNAVEELSDYIQKVYNENFKELVRNINNTTEIIKGIIDGLNLLITMLYEKRIIDGLKESSIDRKQFENSIEELKINLTKWTDFLHDLKAASPILENHLDDIVRNMKPLIVNQIFEPSHYDDMFILNTQAHARLDQMAQ